MLIGKQWHPSLWHGTSASWVDLSPPNASSEFAAFAGGIDGNTQVGTVKLNGFLEHAVLWHCTPGSMVHLNPDNAAHSVGTDADGEWQVGAADCQGMLCASLWHGSPDTWVSLNPPDATESFCDAAQGGHQVGFARSGPGGIREAVLWNGTPTSAVRLHPDGATWSIAEAVHGDQQAGYATFDRVDHAGIWSGTKKSWQDLHSLLGPEFTSSHATGIWHANGHTCVVGTANSDVTGNDKAVMWVSPPLPPPCPGNVNGDGAVDVDGLFDVINHWGPCPSPCPPVCVGDITSSGGDCNVDVDDLFTVINGWGPCS